VGTELLLGRVQNTNATYLSLRLAQLGIDVVRHVVIGDTRAEIGSVLLEALEATDVVVLSGGLGPTDDDLTRDAVCETLGRPLVYDKSLEDGIRSFFRGRPEGVPERSFRQAYRPADAIPLANRNGTAPGLWLDVQDKVVIILPGPPRELEPMVDEEVVPRLKTRTGGMVVLSHSVWIAGREEPVVQDAVVDLFRLENPNLGIYATPGQIELRVTAQASSRAEAESLTRPVVEDIRARLGVYVFGEDDDTLAGVAGRMLKSRGLTLAAAESCTGGLLGAMITAVPGSSTYFRGGVVSYDANVKVAVLGVPQTIIDHDGVVSGPCAEAMANGAMRVIGSDAALSITGWAGPDGEQVGTVVIGLALKNSARTLSKVCHFPGNRDGIRVRAAYAALDLLRRTLMEVE
jgi:nicotinamide-nucleotide amidase